MNLQEAINAMYLGSKVKLPEWTGYWFVPAGEVSEDPKSDIKAFLKNGDIANDFVWIDKYKDRTDFEITEGNMGFDFAILALKNGKRVARKGWNGNGMYIIQFTGTQIANAFGYGFGESMGEFRFSTVFAIKTAQNEMVMGWKPTSPDMMAEDWVVVE